MLHKAKKAYYACDVIRFLVPYAAHLKLLVFFCLPSTVTLYESRGCAYGLRGTRTLFTRRQAGAIAT